MFFTLRVLLRMRASVRPGVPTTMWGQFFFRTSSSFLIAMPPKNTDTLTVGMYLEKRSYSLLIWKANSRVWHITRTDTCKETTQRFYHRFHLYIACTLLFISFVYNAITISQTSFINPPNHDYFIMWKSKLHRAGLEAKDIGHELKRFWFSFRQRPFLIIWFHQSLSNSRIKFANAEHNVCIVCSQKHWVCNTCKLQ